MYTPSDKQQRQPDFVGETVSLFGPRDRAMKRAGELANLVPEGMHRQTFVSRKEFSATEGWFRYEVKVDGWYDPPYQPS